jgi:hypothetical protein
MDMEKQRPDKKPLFLFQKNSHMEPGTMSKLLKTLLLPCLAITCVGCSSKYEPRETIIDERAANRVELYEPATELERQAYQKGVQDVLTDLKGKMSARNRFTWESPIVECGVVIPARVMNGTLIPSHEECVQIAPGRWTEEAPTFLPVLGAEHE